MADERTIPILPSRDLDETLAFYERLGFATRFSQTTPNVYAIVRREAHELHFFGHPGLDPYASDFMCYLRMPDPDAWHREFAKLGLPKE